MNTFEICKNIRAVILSTAGSVAAYTSWSAEFAKSELVGLSKRIEDRSKWFKKVDVNDLTAEQLDELEFGRWSEDNPMRLIPIWLLPYLQDTIDAQCIDGEKITLTADMDNDHRGGFLAYGVIPKQ